MKNIRVALLAVLLMNGCTPCVVRMEISDANLIGLNNVDEFIYQNVQEIEVRITPNEPTQVTFPRKISCGFKRTRSITKVERKDSYIILFTQQELPKEGELFVVILEDGTGFPLRIKSADSEHLRTPILEIKERSVIISSNNNLK